MANETNNTVTISADYFAELYAKANDGERIRRYCFECKIAKERDELKAKLESKCAGCNRAVDATAYELRLAAAERCIEDIEAVMMVSVIAECAEGMKVNDIISAWREKREAT